MSRELTQEDKWIEEYEPIEDVANSTDLWDTDDPLMMVIKPEHVWTLCDGDDHNGYIEPGFAFVNRIGYYITRKPWDKYNKPNTIKCIWPQD